MDETWLHHYTPETKEQLKQWVFEGERDPKKVKSACMVMATVFWDARRIIYTDFLEKGQTITGAYYASSLQQLSVEINAKTSSFEKEKDPLPSSQYTGALLCSFDDQNDGIKIRIITKSTVFTGFGPPVTFFYFQT